MTAIDHEARKQLLVAQAEFDRIKFALAVHDVRRLVRRPVEAHLHTRSHSAAAKLLGFALPILGASRAGRVVRAMTIALSIYRFVRRLAPR
jgi:hypothetical protein